MARGALGLFLFLLVVSSNVLLFVHSARLLDEAEAQPQVVPGTIPQPNPGGSATVTSPQQPSGQIPAVGTETPPEDDLPETDSDDDTPVPPVTPPVTKSNGPGPVGGSGGIAGGSSGPGGIAGGSSGPGGIAGGSSGPGGIAGGSSGSGGLGGSGGAGGAAHEPTLEFYMHDVLGGSHPSARVVTGIIAQTEINGIPFSKANNNIFPVDNGIPLVNINNINKIINPNTAPLLTGLNGARPNTIIQTTNGNNNNALSNNLPFVTAGQLPPAAALQQLMFGTITVVDDELTEAHELGSTVIGRAQGFYLASSLDGTSQTLALTMLLHGDKDHHDTVDDAISFFGVHRTAGGASQIAVVGGTGKYEHAKGYAVVETLHNQVNQHVTDGEDTILHFTVYIDYKE